jgi:hypothetical protein
VECIQRRCQPSHCQANSQVLTATIVSQTSHRVRPAVDAASLNVRAIGKDFFAPSFAREHIERGAPNATGQVPQNVHGNRAAANKALEPSVSNAQKGSASAQRKHIGRSWQRAKADAGPAKVLREGAGRLI